MDSTMLEEDRLKMAVSEMFSQRYFGSEKFELWTESVRKMIHLQKGERLYNLLKEAVIHHVETRVYLFYL